MSDKPSLYVVEKKEVVILVVLFVVVTVLSFTMGVRYGESVGKKTATEQLAAEKEHSDQTLEKLGGTLGGESKSVENEHEAPKAEDGHGHEPVKAEKPEAAHGEHGEHAEKAAESSESKEKKEDAHETSPERAAKDDVAPATKEAVEKSSDEYLLNALKDAGVEPPGGKPPGGAKLPDDVKKPRAAPPRAKTEAAHSFRAGTFVIQVGSHPTLAEANGQLKALRGKKVSAEILPPFKDRQGEWHRVVIGNFKTKKDAEKEAKALKGRGSILSYFVWRLP